MTSNILLVILLLLFVIPTSTKLVSLSGLNSCDNDPKEKYSQKLYGVPYNDSDTEFTAILYYDVADNKQKLKYPTGPQIESFYPFEGDEYRICYKDTINNLFGKVYMTDETPNVYQWRDKDYSIDSTEKYTVIFSRNIGGAVILRNFTTTDFIVYSGLPEDETRTGIYMYNADLPVDELYIQDDYFHVESLGSSFKVEVHDGTESPLSKVFKSNGLIVSPGFPSTPSAEYQKCNISVEKSDVDRMITFQITSSESLDEVDIKNKLASNAVKSTQVVKVSYGDIQVSFASGSSGQQVLPFPAHIDGFSITASSAYAIQFDLPEAVTASTTESTQKSTKSASEVTTQNPNAPTSKSPEDCSCSSSTSFTTETPATTTDSGVVSSVISVFAMSIVYLL